MPRPRPVTEAQKISKLCGVTGSSALCGPSALASATGMSTDRAKAWLAYAGGRRQRPTEVKLVHSEQITRALALRGHLRRTTRSTRIGESGEFLNTDEFLRAAKPGVYIIDDARNSQNTEGHVRAFQKHTNGRVTYTDQYNPQPTDYNPWRRRSAYGSGVKMAMAWEVQGSRTHGAPWQKGGGVGRGRTSGG